MRNAHDHEDAKAQSMSLKDKLYHELTPEEQKTWWLEQAQDAIKAYKLDDTEILWLAYTHNAVFDVKQNENHYVLNLYRHEHVRWDRVDAMFYWIKRLRQDAQLQVPEPTFTENNGRPVIIPLRNGERSNWVNAVLVNHLDGVTRSGEEVSLDEMNKIGQFLGKFHTFSEAESHKINPVDFAQINMGRAYSEKTGFIFRVKKP